MQDHSIAPAMPKVAHASSGLGLCLPGVACRGDVVAGVSSPVRRDDTPHYFEPPTAKATPHSMAQGAPPPPVATMRLSPEEDLSPPEDKCRPMLGIPSRQAVANGKPMLDIPSRQTEAAPSMQLGIPGIGTRKIGQADYVTDTVTTPQAKTAAAVKSRPNTGPVPLFSFKSNASLNSALAGYSISRESEHDEDAPQRFESSTSLRWTPDIALMQCWHRKLSDRYQDYNVASLIGQGRYGAVFCVQHKNSGKVYACKVLHKAEQEKSSMRNEIQNLRMLDHPNVVRLYEVNEEADVLFLLMEYCRGGDLFGLVTESPDGCLPEADARTFAYQMLDALSYCHSMGIVHRDVKPENFLLSDKSPSTRTLKLADFGIATQIRCTESQKEGQVNGSIPYMAPELFTKRWSSLVRESDGNRAFLSASDLWSCGVVIYVMLSGDLPYGDDVYRIAEGEKPDFSKEIWQGISRDAIALILNLMQPDIEARWTARGALKHEWYAGKNDRTSSSSTARNGFNTGPYDFGEGNVFPQGSHELARSMIRYLRRWKQQPWLRRMVLALIAKRIEPENPSRKLADSAFQTFKGSHDKLKVDALVEAINTALLHTPRTEQALRSPGNEFQQNFQAGFRTSKSSSSLGSSVSFSPSDGHSVTGLHIRQRLKKAIGLGRLPEDTPMGNSPRSQYLDGMTPSEDFVSLSELRYLVSALDGPKKGTVDYTLFVASFIPSKVYCEEERVVEAFSQIDFVGRGQIWPADLQKLLSTSMEKKDSDLNTFKEMVNEFDINGDGFLDLFEFRQMLRAEQQGDDQSATASATPLTTPASQATPIMVPTASPT